MKELKPESSMLFETWGGGMSSPISVRDWVAVMALQGILAAEGVSKLGHRDSQKSLATVAYSMADAMVAASKSPSA